MAGEIIFISVLIGMVIGLLIVLGFYLVEAFGLYGISKNRGYQKPWLAFIPVANGYLLGSIADNINYCFGKKTSFRIWMLIARILSTINAVISTGYAISIFPWMLEQVIRDPENFMMQGIPRGFLLLSSVSGLIGLGVTVLLAFVFYRIFQDYTTNAMAYTLLSVLIPMFFGVPLASFLLLSIRNKPAASLQIRQQQTVPNGVI